MRGHQCRVKGLVLLPPTSRRLFLAAYPRNSPISNKSSNKILDIVRKPRPPGGSALYQHLMENSMQVDIVCSQILLWVFVNLKKKRQYIEMFHILAVCVCDERSVRP